MIAGLFLRNYRCYRATNFIPVTDGPHFAIYIGPNGVGKSSIFDALDKYFNGGDWSVNIQAKRDGGLSGDDKIPFICPIFLIPKESIPEALEEVAQKLSDALWEWSGTGSEELRKFAHLRSTLQATKESHLLLALGRVPADGRVFLGPFEKDKAVKSALGLSQHESATAILQDLQRWVLAYYAFFYIPVETDPLLYTKLEKQQIQSLLDEDILSEISAAITQRTVTEINNKLGVFLQGIHESLPGYRYKAGYGDSLTLKNVTSKVFESYFSKKILHKRNGEANLAVSDLSAGEKRRAL